MRERSNEAPLLLLDDVLSELDEERAAAFLAEIGDYEQAFVTATHLPGGLHAGARVARVEDGSNRGIRGMLKLSQAISGWAPADERFVARSVAPVAGGLERDRRRARSQQTRSPSRDRRRNA